MSRSLATGPTKKVKSLVVYMTRFSALQGLVTTGVLLVATPYLPTLFTTDLAIRGHLQSLMPQLAWQQVLVSFTLVAEALAIGGNRFGLLAVGTTLATILSVGQIKQATTVVDIWSRGIVTLFAGRFLTAILGVIQVIRDQKREIKDNVEVLP